MISNQNYHHKILQKNAHIINVLRILDIKQNIINRKNNDIQKALRLIGIMKWIVENVLRKENERRYVI